MRKSKRILNKLLSVGMTALMAVGMLSVGGADRGTDAVKAAALDSASQVNFRTVLGRATDFGLTAATLNQKHHMETTYATKMFNNSADNNDIDMAGGLPVHFIIGATTGNGVRFGKVAVDGMILNVETTQEIADNIVIMGASDENKPTVVTNVAEKSAIDANIDSIIEHVQDESAYLAGRSTTDGYSITGNGNITLDLSNEKFKESVVYINVETGDQIANAIKASNGLRIKKYSSTVVVFNLPATNNGDKLSINQYTVEVIDKNNEVLVTDHRVNANGNVTPEMIEKDAEICQKIIFNMPNSTKVDLDTTLGCFIVPRNDAFVTGGSSGGWVATGGTFATTGEWHFIYQGRNTTVSTDDSGTSRSMNFAARKAFTHSYDVRDSVNSVEEDKNIKAVAGEYQFQFYEADANFDINSANLIETVSNDAVSNITFSTLTFSEEGDYYYIIKEAEPGKVKNGITNSDGELDILLHVDKVTNGDTSSFVFTITTWKYITAEDKANNKPANYRAPGVMSGVEWTLGGIYNLADLGNLEITVVDKDTGDLVPNAKVDVTAPDGTKTTYTTDSNGKIEVNNTPSGDYKIVVTEVPEGYRVTTGEEATKTVENNKTAEHVAEITPTGGLKVTVLEEDTGEPVKDAVVKITDKNGNSKEYTTDAKGEIIINPTDTGDYQIVVTKVPEGKKVTVGETTTVTVKKLEIAEHVAKINTANTGTLEITVRDEVTNDPVPNADVKVTDPSGNDSNHTTDQNGTITIENTPTGDYTVEVTKVPEGYTVTTGQKTTVTVKENEKTTQTIVVTSEDTPTTTTTTTTTTEATPSTTPNTTTVVTSTNDSSPKTGDTHNTMFAFVIMLMSLAGLAMVGYMKKKEN
ncbi:MAG: carboxypeptidase regulatory-like domain-containing protein [Lachnospiraceae bacterium]|nr:carboxypeptidase regulatory-like domain-containing protein [Lachnospiraceae bacterium]